MDEPRRFLIDIFERAVQSVDADICVPPALPAPPSRGRIIILAAGKAACAMARAAERHYLQLIDADLISGLVTTRAGYELPCQILDIVVAGHPLPDRRSESAARRTVELAASAGPDDLVLALISGGASALWALPIEGIGLDDKRRISQSMLRAGADISELNCVRRHLSRIKGGKLARAASRANLITLAISDVTGDVPSVIGSGPTVAEPTSSSDALACLHRYGLKDDRVAAALANSSETKGDPNHPTLPRSTFRLVARPQDALEAAAAFAAEHGYKPSILGADIAGDAQALAKQHAKQALALRDGGDRTLLLSGGEATVQVKGDGRGGPNQEFALALACALDGEPGIWGIAADSDGTDGGRGDTNDPAGAIIEPQTLIRARRGGLDPLQFLENNDSTCFFEAVGGLLITGPTFTNVNDFRAILIEPRV